ncbi:unnamed protein product [Anisakis simplex]|uniref:Reticulon-4-interacting protein 1, mitochondrial (inferred by orthology to a human protein) n=1 Tax=Anisakis simplex TaxID=6269 RepID=A0A0M3KIN8_ANISI|nr:unnamed protein product [Anisakis simplex]
MPSLNNLNKPNLVSPPPQQSATTSMNVWCVRDFGSPLVKQTMSIPEINNTDQVLIKVKASSVNPLDTEMVNGYGRRLLSVVKQLESCSTNAQSMLPLIAGRDCSGVVEYKGQQVTKFDIGDEVMGIVAPTWTGAHAEYVLSKESWCVKKPNNISHVQAAALPYVACTVWAALVSVSGFENVSSRHQFSIDSDFVYCNYSEKNRKEYISGRQLYA